MTGEPTLAEFDTLTRDAFARLPKEFRALTGNVVVHVAEEAEPELLKELGILNPLQLSGLFEGLPVTETGPSDPLGFPNHVHLYRRSILAEWRESPGVSLQELITHVLVHEIGHHFGLSDDDMHRIEEAAAG